MEEGSGASELCKRKMSCESYGLGGETVFLDV